MPQDSDQNFRHSSDHNLSEDFSKEAQADAPKKSFTGNANYQPSSVAPSQHLLQTYPNQRHQR